MKIINITQGTPEWLELRRPCDCSSDAAAVLDLDPHRLRNDYIRMKALGDAKTFSEWEQKYLLDRGHEIEAKARALREEEIGEMITPVVITNDEGTKLASLDGATILFDTVLECKSWNKELAAYVREHDDLPPTHWPQCEAILDASDDEIKAVQFIVSDGTAENRVMLDYVSQPKRRKQLRAAWKQAAIDVTEYKHVEIAPKAIGTALRPLPQLAVVVMGAVERSNFPEFKEGALAMIKAIPTELKTDQNFADAVSAVKWLDAGEKQCEEVKKMVLAGAASINEVMLGLDEIRETMRQKRLPLKSLIETRKSAIRAEIAAEGREAIRKYLWTLNESCGGYMPEVAEAIGDRMAGKREISTLRNAMETEVARVKAEASDIATRILANRAVLETAREHAFLFSDGRSLCQNHDTESLQSLVNARIIEHKAKEERRLEAERERIRLEERAKAERESRERERLAQEQRDREAQAAERERLAVAERVRQEAAAQMAARKPDFIDVEIVEPAKLPPKDEPASLPVSQAGTATGAGFRGSARQTLLKQKPDDEPFEEWVIRCVADQYEVDVQTAAAWLLTMKFEDITERHALQGLLGELF